MEEGWFYEGGDIPARLAYQDAASASANTAFLLLLISQKSTKITAETTVVRIKSIPLALFCLQDADGKTVYHGRSQNSPCAGQTGEFKASVKLKIRIVVGWYPIFINKPGAVEDGTTDTRRRSEFGRLD
jgi:hypothetical protein